MTYFLEKIRVLFSETKYAVLFGENFTYLTTLDSTAGDSTAGDSPAGDSTAGDSTAGDSTAGDSPAGDLTAGDSSADKHRYTALKFGNSLPDYIIFKPNMEPLRNAFSVCSWIRHLRSRGFPSWLSYAVNSGNHNEIFISSDGYNVIFDQHWDLTSEMSSVPSGTWYHYCGTWSLSSLTHRVYLNGQLIGSRPTPPGYSLRTDGYLVIGNDQDSYGGGMEERNIFGGELYKLNLFSKELSRTEVQEMAEDKCTEIEETFGVVRAIKWEQILLETRNGDVSEIESGCISRLKLLLQQTTSDLEDKEQQMNTTLAELEETISDLKEKEQQMKKTQIELEVTKSDLEVTKSELEVTKSDLEDKKQRMNTALTELEETKSDLEEKEQQLGNFIAFFVAFIVQSGGMATASNPLEQKLKNRWATWL